MAVVQRKLDAQMDSDNQARASYISNKMERFIRARQQIEAYPFEIYIHIRIYLSNY